MPEMQDQENPQEQVQLNFQPVESINEIESMEKVTEALEQLVLYLTPLF